MNKIIKFRGIYHGGEGWIYGHYVTFQEDDHNYADHFIYTGKRDLAYGSGTCWNIGERVSVKPNTVGQFIGLLDKNENEIYEGDIVRCLIEGKVIIGHIQYTPDCYSLVVPSTEPKVDTPCLKWTGNPTYIQDWANANEIEVIGNIYETPHLCPQ